MNILVTGASGLIGSKFTSYLTQNKHHVLRLVRRTRAAVDEVRWDPVAGILDAEPLERLDAVVHLAGENIASGRWTAEKKRRIRESRIEGTRFLAQSLARLFDPPRVFVSMSAIGYYGDRGEEQIDEESDAGTGFLPELCKEWENATSPAVIRGIRVVTPRVGMVLSAEGGALAKMLPAFRLGIGGRIGDGRQYISWIAVDDLIGILDHAIHNDTLHGPLNAVTPNPATNREFSATLGRVLSKPAVFALPAAAARILFGKMADEVLLAGARVLPTRLKETGYKYKFPELESALRYALQTSAQQG
jgi:uncharacterized protein (TIGR01777 family)